MCYNTLMARKITNIKNVIKKYNTIIFDFDGTLINSEPAHNEGHRVMLETIIGKPIPNFKDFVEMYIGKRDSVIFEEFKEIFHLDCDTSLMFDLKRRAVLDILLNDDKCMLKYIDDIFSAKDNRRYYILSNNHKSFIEEILDKKGYCQYIDQIFCMEDMNTNKEYFLEHIDDYISDVDKSSLIICEDSVPFIKYLVDNGYDTLAVESEFNLGRVNNAKYIIKDGFEGE